MSDFELVRDFIKQKNFTPQYTTMDSYITCVILSYEADLESEGLSEDDMSLESWLGFLCMNYRLEDFDY